LIVKLVLSKKPIRDYVFIVKFFCVSRGTTNKTTIKFADIFYESTDAKKYNLPFVVDNRPVRSFSHAEHAW
tara:strand:+ start:10315 stop:10527 length:213 start_codon:yes stop_codon:yes gene_type:complete